MKAGLEKKKYFPDPFHPRFQEELELVLTETLGRYKDDPWLLGVFIDNERPWARGRTAWKDDPNARRLSAMALVNGPQAPIKRFIAGELRGKYHTIDRLNKQWGAQFPSWDGFLESCELPQDKLKGGFDDFKMLDAKIAEAYFSGCRRAMDNVLPGILYLGCRFNVAYTPEAVEVASRHCDVVSFNIYEELPDARSVDELATKLDFPVIIGEFHFGAKDRGMFHGGLILTSDQAERAEKFAAYMKKAAASPWRVGAHWFCYTDQPLTGRGDDGENFAIGFVDATDDPHPEMVEAAKRFHQDLYRLRSK